MSVPVFKVHFLYVHFDSFTTTFTIVVVVDVVDVVFPGATVTFPGTTVTFPGTTVTFDSGRITSSVMIGADVVRSDSAIAKM